MSGQEEETQDEVHRDEADADAEELALVEAALGPPHVGRSDGPDAQTSRTANTTPTRTVAIVEGAMPLLA